MIDGWSAMRSYRCELVWKKHTEDLALFYFTACLPPMRFAAF